jgi:hypothetical protein
LAPAFAIRTAQPLIVETTTPCTNTTEQTHWTSWFSYALRTPSRKEVEVGLEARWKQLEEDVSAHRSKFEQHMEQVSQQSKKCMEELDENIDKERKKLKRRIEADILKQKRGCMRFLNSVRAQTGIVVGGAMTFGAVTSPTLQTARLTWGALDKYNVTRGIHDPWMKDATSGILAITIIAKTSKESNEESKFTQRTIPLMTIGLAIVESVGMILDNIEGNVRPTTRIAVKAISAVLGTAALSLIPLPISSVATSIAGASLLFQSVVAEVVGNWWAVLQKGSQRFEKMDLEQRRKIEKGIRKQVYRELEKKLIYPITNVFDEVAAAIRNEDLEEPSLQNRIHQAIQQSLKVKLVWSFASAGIMFQLLWRTKPVEHATCAFQSWFSGITRQRPRPVKNRRKN